DCRQLVAMESVRAVGRSVQRDYEESRQNEDASITGDDPLAGGGQPHKYRNHYNADERTQDSATQLGCYCNLTICRLLAHWMYPSPQLRACYGRLVQCFEPALSACRLANSGTE